MKRIVIFVAGLVFAGVTTADTLIGRVIKVSDGDTITVLSNNKRERIRFAQIDAPEKDQPHGLTAKQWLTERIADQVVSVEYSKRDRYKRIVGEVYLANQRINAELVRAGHAWVYDYYATDKNLYPLQTEAKAKMLGLWSQPDPVAPWVWRKAHRIKK